MKVLSCMTVGHCLQQLGSGGRYKPSPPESSEQSPGGGPGAEAPEALAILQYTVPKNAPPPKKKTTTLS